MPILVRSPLDADTTIDELRATLLHLDGARALVGCEPDVYEELDAL